MEYLFKQSVCLGGKDYLRGSQHSVPEKIEYSQVFIRYVGLGLIVEAEAKTISPESLAERQQRFHDKLVKRAAEAKASKKPEVAVPVKEQAPIEQVAEKVAEEKADAEMVSDKISDQGEAPAKAEKNEKKKNKKG